MPIRVLVVEDSPTARHFLLNVLRADPTFEVVAVASDGREAIAQCQRHAPQVVTMDMALPVMSGLKATEFIMAHCPVPILVVSGSLDRGEVFKSYDALAAGAVEVIEKPDGMAPAGDWERRFLALLRLVSRVRVITHPRAKLEGMHHEGKPRREAAFNPGERFDLIAMGASTGGPGALSQVLKELPATIALPILVVIHISESFASQFADWLALQVGRPVKLAQQGERLHELRGVIRLAPYGKHLNVVGQELRLVDSPPRFSCKPSVDELFESVAENAQLRSIGVLLTGMGRDGAAGLLKMRRAGSMTIAQDEASSVVYGMPKEAAEIGAAQSILPLHEIAPALHHWSRSKRGEQ